MSAPPSVAPTESSTTNSPWKRRGIVLGVVSAALGGSYLTGRLQTSGHIDEARAKVTAAEERVRATEGTLSGERALVQRLEARRQLHLALLALDERNFGIAERHVREAAAQLGHSQPEAGGELARVAAELSQFRLVATEDMGPQRARILGWVARFDQAVPGPSVKP